jgi:hypothetical protein
MSKYILKETIEYPFKNKGADSIESMTISIYENDGNHEIAYYDWYGNIKSSDIITFMEDYFKHKIQILSMNDGNGRVNITYQMV